MNRVARGAVLALALLAALGTTVATAAPRFSVGIDGGFGAIREEPFTSSTSTPFYLAFHGHWLPRERLQLGLSLGGLLLEAADLNYPERGGMAASEFLFTAGWRPLRRYPAFWLEGAAGGVVYSANNPVVDDDGSARQLATGVDAWHARSWRAAPFVAFDEGEARARGHSAWIAGLRLEWLLPAAPPP